MCHGTHQAPELLERLLDFRRPGEPAVEADEIAVVRLGGEDDAGSDADAAGERFPEENPGWTLRKLINRVELDKVIEIRVHRGGTERSLWAVWSS